VQEATNLVKDVCLIVLEYDACFQGALETSFRTSVDVDSMVQLSNGTFALVFGNRVDIWDKDLSSKRCVLGHSTSKRVVAAVALPESAHLAILSSKSAVAVWDTERNVAVAKFNSNVGPFPPMYAMVSLPNGDLVFNQQAEIIARTRSGALVGAMTQDRGGVTSVVALSNGTVAFGAWTMVRVWDTSRGAQTLGHHTGHVNIVAGLPNNKLASCCELSELFIWDAANCSRLRCCTTNVFAMTHSFHGNLVTINSDHTMKAWETSTGTCVAKINNRFTTQRYGLLTLANGSVVYHFTNTIYIYN